MKNLFFGGGGGGEGGAGLKPVRNICIANKKICGINDNVFY